MRGTESKLRITQALLQIFPGSFMDADNKTVRIPTTCEGETIEIKVALTAAKDIVGGSAKVEASSKQPAPQNTQLTEEEIIEVRKLIESLHL